MSKPASSPPPPEVPPAIVGEWWLPFADFLANERRYSPYTLRNYRQAFTDFYLWLQQSKHKGSDFNALTPRDISITSAEEVSDDFNPRRAARRRRLLAGQ